MRRYLLDAVEFYILTPLDRFDPALSRLAQRFQFSVIFCLAALKEPKRLAYNIARILIPARPNETFDNAHLMLG